MGGGLRALGNGTTAIFQNPANLAESRVYHLEATAQITPEAGRQVYGGSVVDSVTGRLAGGLSVHGGFVNGHGQTHELDRSLLDVRLALAYPISDSVFLGLGGRYSKVSQGGVGGPFSDSKVSGGLVEQGQSDVTNRHAFVNTPTFDAGLTVKASDALHIGVSGQNLTYPKNGILPTMLGGGVGYGTPDFSLELDALADFNSYSKTTARVMFGGEVLLGDHVPLRAGYRYDQGASKHAASLGVGYTSPQFSFEAGVRRTLSDPGATTIVIGVAYFLESSGITRSPTDSQ
jgi:opacity protein-like surface antigen